MRGITVPQQEALKTASVALWSLSGIAPGHVLAETLDGSNDTRNGLIASWTTPAMSRSTPDNMLPPKPAFMRHTP